MRFKIYPYKLGSQSAKTLAQALGVKRVRPTYRARRDEIIINWGNSRAFAFPESEHDLNKPAAITLASNKLKTFETLSNNNFTHTPQWMTSKENAIAQIELGNTIYCRTTLTGHSGSGIIIADTIDKLVNAPLYTVGTKHKYEFRVHVFKGTAIDVQQKKRRSDWSGTTIIGIRNHANGYIYARSDINIPSKVTSAAIDAVNLLGLDFGAVDIGYRERDDKAFVFEINTAPGLAGSTINTYKNAFNNYLNGV